MRQPGDVLEKTAALLSKDSSIPLTSVETFGEIWLIILVQALKIPPQQAVTLLRTPGALSRGMSWGADNGKGADVLRWIRSLYANRQVQLLKC